MSSTQQHSNGSSSKPKAAKGLGPMVLPPLPPFGPKGSRSRKIESTSATDILSTNSDFPSDSAIFPTKGAQSVSEKSKVDMIENQKNGNDVEKKKGRYEDIDKLLDVDPALFGDDEKLREADSTKKVEGKEGKEGKGEMNFELEGDGLGLMDADIFGQGDGEMGEGLGIASLDLLVDLPDPLDLGKNMFGVETIMEEDEEVEAGEELEEGSDDFLEDESSEEDVEEEEKERVKVGTVAAMINNVEGEIRKSPPEERRRKGKEMMVEKKKKEEVEEDAKMEDEVEVSMNDELSSSVKEDKAEMPSARAVKSMTDDHVAMDTDKDDDNDINDSNYPGINGRLPSEDSVMGSVKLTCEGKKVLNLCHKLRTKIKSVLSNIHV